MSNPVEMQVGWKKKRQKKTGIIAKQLLTFVTSVGGCCERVMAEGIVRDISQVHSSVLDHKPILRKEIETFVKEFEERRKDSEVDHLFRILERVTELKDTEIPRTASLADIHLPKILAEVQVAESISSKLIDRFQTADSNYTENLEKGRKERAAEWDLFVHDMTNKCINIDNLYKGKEEEVRKLYLKAEEPFQRTSP